MTSSTLRKYAPFLAAALMAVWVVWGLRGPGGAEDEFAIEEFGQLPVIANGRIQPMDSLARNALLRLRGRQSVDLRPWADRGDGEVITATEWMAAMMMNPELANTWPVFRIDHPELQGLLNLSRGAYAGARTDGKHFTWPSILNNLEDLQREARRVGGIDQAQRTSYERAVIQLWSAVGLHMRLQNTVQPQNARDWERELRAFAANAPGGIAAMMAREAGASYDAELLRRTERDLQRFEVMNQLDPPLIIPPPTRNEDAPEQGWMTTVDALVGIARGEPVPAGLEAYARMAGAYRSGNAVAFNDALERYASELREGFPREVGKASKETLFNQMSLFHKALVAYGLAFLGAAGFWLAPHRLDWLRRAVIALVLAAFAAHTAGLLFRMTLEGRPPVTNLYSSAIFIGWGACVLGLIIERFWRNSLGAAVSGVVGFLTMIIAHRLAMDGDTMEMMHAVLDTNFWLATHVVVITLGYSAMFVAGSLAAVCVLRGLCTPSVDADTTRSFGRMVYGVVCFATLFTFVGTLLGGIWADQSWGRFWGWDPKENGALILVLWNAIILHARWGGIIRERGIMVLAILGNVATAWSWFGVNMLGIGLHSYGFTDSGFRWLLLFAASQILLAAAALLPARFWRSRFRE